jgi:hypothetical protein
MKEQVVFLYGGKWFYVSQSICHLLLTNIRHVSWDGGSIICSCFWLGWITKSHSDTQETNKTSMNRLGRLGQMKIFLAMSYGYMTQIRIDLLLLVHVLNFFVDWSCSFCFGAPLPPHVILLFFNTSNRSLHDLAYVSLELGENVIFVEDDIEKRCHLGWFTEAFLFFLPVQRTGIFASIHLTPYVSKVSWFFWGVIFSNPTPPGSNQHDEMETQVAPATTLRRRWLGRRGADRTWRRLGSTVICAVATAAAALRRGRRLGVLDAALGDRRTRSPTRTRAAAPSYFCSLTFKLGFCRLFVLLINAAILLP